MARRNPLTDELTAEAKAELAAMFADMKSRYQPRGEWQIRIINGRRVKVRAK